jgi:hypothetical protein
MHSPSGNGTYIHNLLVYNGLDAESALEYRLDSVCSLFGGCFIVFLYRRENGKVYKLNIKRVYNKQNKSPYSGKNPY